MNYIDNYQSSKGGFDFTLAQRNHHLTNELGYKQAGFTKTGTTIVGLVFNGGVVIAADTRATAGSIVADKNCEKLHPLAPNIWCAGAGTAADLHHATAHMNAKLKLQRLNTGRQSRVNEVVTKFCEHLFRYQGHVGVALIIAGVDATGPQLCSISPHGNYIYHPFQSMGSGSLAALGILEAKYQDNLSQQDAINLAIEGIEAGIFHDLGSGSNVDVAIITKDGIDFRRNIRSYNQRTFQRTHPYEFKPNNIPTINKFVFDIEKQDLFQEGQEAMEIVE